MGTGGLDAHDVKRTLGRMAHEILEKSGGADELVVVGVLQMGYPVAQRLAFAMANIEGVGVPCGSLDIEGFRDDRRSSDEGDKSEIPFAVNGKRVILVDEVIQTGRTIRAAMDSLMRHGRPAKIELAVLIDRGGRELPIEPNYVGRKMEVSPDEVIEVRLDAEGEEVVRVVKGSSI
ncbi:MAG: bifunctional pyr operon transcriptional regulator/uracil phosphoribosyltransferase PyrR [Armatimonadota bacterium]|nr:bifunctional pyr operon transcriptional regulator/uracil phosphoribosyltransferase PyrR [Armatimonadota bacterium]